MGVYMNKQKRLHKKEIIEHIDEDDEDEDDEDDEIEQSAEDIQQAVATVPEFTESPDEVVARLAALSPLEYDRIRAEEAKRLKVRVTQLDREVKQARKKIWTPSKGGSRRRARLDGYHRAVARAYRRPCPARPDTPDTAPVCHRAAKRAGRNHAVDNFHLDD